MQYVTLWELFVAFFRVGLFTFGGGYAMLPLFEREVVDKKQWAKKEEMLDIYALAQSVPGVIAVNSAIFLGNRVAGIKGAIAAAAGMIAPSLLVIVGIALFFMQIQNNIHVLRAFSGIRAAVVGLIAAATCKIALGSIRDRPALVLALAALALNVFTTLHPAWIILLGGLSGFVVYYSLSKKRSEGEKS